MKPLQELFDDYRSLQARVDDWFARCLAAAPQSIRCAEGCSGCCRGLFDISYLDAQLLRIGFDALPEQQRLKVRGSARARMQELEALWPEFAPPYILNELPFEDWRQMPEQDETPCPLLGEDGLCLVYAYRPLTCRLHGLPQVELTGELFDGDCCSLNHFPPEALQSLPRLPFAELFREEGRLIQAHALALLGQSRGELDTLIPAAVLIDFDQWQVEGK